MKNLNLVDVDKSDIKYKISKFPSGQQNIIIDKNDCLEGDFILTHKECIVIIKSRLNNFLDLELIMCACASLRELGVEEIHLYVPFIDGRQDNKFEEGSNYYIKSVLAPIINSLNFKSVTCIDSHSLVLDNCINNFKKVSNLELVKFTIQDLCGFTHGRNPKVDEFILVSPDAGASKKIYKIAEQIGYKGNIITCSKDRDVNGNLNKVVVPLNGSIAPEKDFVIIDDICDGGATFINIAKEINKYYEGFNTKKYLIVTHGIFSKGTTELGYYFDGIYCTNSYQSFSNAIVHNSSLIKQLNIF
jgi:ribose-phosphate pyrophosphokinase